MTLLYVATGGNDTTGTGAIGAPWLTIQKGCDALTAGDTLYIRGGSYAEGARVNKACTIQGYPGDSVPIVTSSTTTVPAGYTQAGSEKVAVFEVTHDGVTLDGLWVRNYAGATSTGSGIYMPNITATPSLTVRNCTVSGNSYKGIRSYNSDGIQVYNCTVYDNGIGVSVEVPNTGNEGLRGRGTSIHNNAIYDNQRLITKDVASSTNDAGAQGVNLERVSGVPGTPILVYSNVIHGNHDWSYDYGYDGAGIEIFCASYVDIYDNVIYDNPHHLETGTQNGSAGGSYNGVPIPVNDVRLYRNLFYRGTTVPIYDWRPAGVQFKTACRVATTANGAFATAFDNASVVDGVTLVTGDRILIKNQTTGSQNGLWIVPASGSPTVRATDSDTGAELLVAACFVTAGTANNNTIWYCSTPATITPNTTALTFVKITPYQSQFAATGFANGLLYAVGDNMVVVKNTLYMHDQTSLSVAPLTGNPFGGTFTGFICEDNLFTGTDQNTTWPCLQIGRDISGSTIDYNFYQAGITNGKFVKTYGDYTGTNGSWSTLANVITNTPWEDNGKEGDPLFIAAGTDFRLQTTSTAVNAATIIAPFTDGYVGPAPDMGYYDTTTGTPPQVPGVSHRFGRRNQIR